MTIRRSVRMVLQIALPGVDIVVVRMRRFIARAIAVSIFVSTLGRVKLIPTGPTAGGGVGPRSTVTSVAPDIRRRTHPT